MKNLTFILLALTFNLNAQNIDLSKWDPEILNKANTAKECQDYSEEEKKVVLFMNLARENGQLFSTSVIEPYVKINRVEDNKYLKSLYKDLKKTEGMEMLSPCYDISSIAKKYAMESGVKGEVGHLDFNKRFEPVLGNPYMNVGENCSYGFDQAIDIVISLLIDDGISSLGHRKNILNSEFNAIGVSIAPHKNYKHCCVIDFGKK